MAGGHQSQPVPLGPALPSTGTDALYHQLVLLLLLQEEQVQPNYPSNAVPCCSELGAQMLLGLQGALGVWEGVGSLISK